jgi:glucose dehydrogenase
MIAVLLVGLAVLVPGVAEAASPSASVPSGSWPYPNGDLANTRDATGAVISSANVSDLKEAWSFNLTGKGATSVLDAGALTSAPIVVNGVVYIQDEESNVYALNFTTGKLNWEYQLNQPLKSGPGPNGVAVANGIVFGASPTTVFALNAATGRPVWVDRHLLKSISRTRWHGTRASFRRQRFWGHRSAGLFTQRSAGLRLFMSWRWRRRSAQRCRRSASSPR